MRSPRTTARSGFRFVRLLSVVLFAFVIISGGLTPNTRRVAAASAAVDQFANVALPGELGQTPFQVWVPATRHTIGGYMLDYWRANGAASVYGNPISEPFASADGFYSQAFEGGVFQFRPELVWTDQPSVVLAPVTKPILKKQAGAFRADGKRARGGGDRRAYAWNPLDPAGSSVQRAVSNGEYYSTVSGHTVTGAFFTWYTTHEGQSYLGEPVSQAMDGRGGAVQYFDGGALFRDKQGNVSVLPIVAENAKSLRIDTRTAERAGLPTYDELLFWKSANPNPIGDPYASGRKWIEVSISQQTLWAYQGETLITTTLVSTGVEPNHTEQGRFHVRYKLEETDMAGTTNVDGEVVETGQSAADDADGSSQIPYVVEDVPNVMYFDMDAEALHGAYWHNNFGTPMSHGCVNLPLDFAAFLYGWAPLGTLVWVHE